MLYQLSLDLGKTLLNTEILKFWYNISEQIKFFSPREHPKALLCCAAPTFMLVHRSLFLKFVNNFEISCQDNQFTLKVEFTL